MIERSRIITPWTLEDGSNEPLLPFVHPVAAWVDVTWQDAKHIPPAPGIYIIEVTAETAQLDVIDADNDYHILWREEIVTEEFSPPVDESGLVTPEMREELMNTDYVKAIIEEFGDESF